MTIPQEAFPVWAVPRIGCHEHSAPYPSMCWWCANAEINGWEGDPVHGPERDPNASQLPAPHAQTHEQQHTGPWPPLRLVPTAQEANS